MQKPTAGHTNDLFSACCGRTDDDDGRGDYSVDMCIVQPHF